jgi:methionyl-tRNA formyltransferase
MIKKEDGLLDFNLPAFDLERRIRAYNPRPGAYTYWKSQILKIHRAHVVDLTANSVGIKIIHQGLPAFTTTIGLLVVDELQPAGKPILSGKAFLQGARNWEG